MKGLTMVNICQPNANKVHVQFIGLNNMLVTIPIMYMQSTRFYEFVLLFGDLNINY